MVHVFFLCIKWNREHFASFFFVTGKRPSLLEETLGRNGPGSLYNLGVFKKRIQHYKCKINYQSHLFGIRKGLTRNDRYLMTKSTNNNILKSNRLFFIVKVNKEILFYVA